MTLVPITLNITCAVAACFAALLPPKEARTAVIVVPILSPKIMAMATSRGISPWEAIAIVKPTVAALACTSMVTMVPAKTARIRCSLKGRNNSCLPSKNDIAFCIIPIPMKRREKPTSPAPSCLCLRFFPNIERPAPMIAPMIAYFFMLKAIN